MCMSGYMDSGFKMIEKRISPHRPQWNVGSVRRSLRERQKVHLHEAHNHNTTNINVHHVKYAVSGRMNRYLRYVGAPAAGVLALPVTLCKQFIKAN